MTVMGVEQLRWSRLYAGATLAGACLGLLVVFEVIPYIPPQLSSWMRSGDTEVAGLTIVVSGALVGFFLTAIAHLGVRWQLRRSSSADL